jgi:hypothetical protein
LSERKPGIRDRISRLLWPSKEPQAPDPPLDIEVVDPFERFEMAALRESEENQE